MAWVQQGTLKGPQGPQGPTGTAGRGISSTQVNGNGELVVTYTDGSSATLGVVRGTNGEAGATFKFLGEVATRAALPAGLGNNNADRGKAYLVTGGAEPDKGNLFAWDGTAWVDGGQIVGPEGPQGPQGPAGPKGDQGDQGIQGIEGAQGPAGIQGVKGDPGPQGDKGDQGIKGDQGLQGIQGVVGSQGEIGPRGEIGPQGPQGVQGEVGPQGGQGVQGTTGVRGSQWYTGNGAPGAITGSLPGDKYLDVVSGTVYDLV